MFVGTTFEQSCNPVAILHVSVLEIGLIATGTDKESNTVLAGAVQLQEVALSRVEIISTRLVVQQVCGKCA